MPCRGHICPTTSCTKCSLETMVHTVKYFISSGKKYQAKWMPNKVVNKGEK